LGASSVSLEILEINYPSSWRLLSNTLVQPF